MKLGSLVKAAGILFLGGVIGNAHAEHRRIAAQAQEDSAGICAEFQSLVHGQQCAHAAIFLRHHQRIAKDDIGAGVVPGFQRHQLGVVGAQMRGALERIGHEGRLAERKRAICFCCCHEVLRSGCSIHTLRRSASMSSCMSRGS